MRMESACHSSHVTFLAGSKETATDQVAQGSCASLDTLICSLLKRLRHNVATLVCLSRKNRAEVAQLVEHSPEKAGVDSSILSLGTIPHMIP